MAGAGALGHSAHNDAHAFRQREFLHDLPQAGTLLGILDLAGDAELLGEGHEHEVAASQRNVGGDTRSLGANGPLGYLDDDIRTYRIDAGNVLGGDFGLLFFPGASLTLDLLQASVERSRDGVPEVKESVLVEADIHEHGLEAGLDVLDAAIEDAAYDILVSLALDGVFL